MFIETLLVGMAVRGAWNAIVCDNSETEEGRLECDKCGRVISALIRGSISLCGRCYSG